MNVWKGLVEVCVTEGKGMDRYEQKWVKLNL